MLLIGLCAALTSCPKPPVVVFIAENFFTEPGAYDVKKSGLCRQGLQVTITTVTKTYTSPKIADLERWELGDIPMNDRYEFVNGSGFTIEAVCLTNDGRTGRSRRSVNSVFSTASAHVFVIETARTEDLTESYMLAAPAPVILVEGQ